LITISAQSSAIDMRAPARPDQPKKLGLNRISSIKAVMVFARFASRVVRPADPNASSERYDSQSRSPFCCLFSRWGYDRVMNTAALHNSAELTALCRQYHVRTLSLFGSASRDEATAQSDVDLLIEFEPGHAPSLAGFARLKVALGQALGVDSIDLATTSILRNPYRRQAILGDLKPLYAA
jgi:predicted nucleotidyltransferase